MFKRSERNPVIDAMYANGLADRAHELLHIEYKD
jgi:iron hydrogenase small subunit